jgi:hypothetical protein
VYQITAYANLSPDLVAVSVTGPANPNQNSTSSYSVSIHNAGTTIADSYTVKLYKDATTELGTQTGTNLAPDSTQTFSFDWMPTVIGNNTLTGKVIYPGDQVAENDVSPPLNIEVLAPATAFTDIGSSHLEQSYPFGVANGYVRSASLFTQTQLGFYGNIMALRWYCSLGVPVEVPYKVYLKTSTASALTAGTWDIWVAGATMVKEGTQVFSQPGWYNFTFTVPYMYLSDNLLVMIETNYGNSGISPYPKFYQSTSTAFQHQVWNANVNPPTGNGTCYYTRPNIRILHSTTAMAHLSGAITSGGTPLAGANVSIQNTPLTATSNAAGGYSFPNVLPGTYTVEVSKVGYISASQQVTLVENQTLTLNIALQPQAYLVILGTVCSSETPTLGLGGAMVQLLSDNVYYTTTDADGQYSMVVLANTTYTYTATKANYQSATGTIAMGSSDCTLDIILNEIAMPVANVQAVHNAAQASVDLAWTAPADAEGEWIRWDTGQNLTSMSPGVADFDYASRWPVAELAEYVGQSLYAVKFYPNAANCTYSIRVWINGSASAPGLLVVDQLVPNPTIAAFNTVILNTPVLINPAQELWFGIHCNLISGYPAGIGAGPAHNGLGNMLKMQGAWTTLLCLELNFDWNLAGYIGYSTPPRFAGMPVQADGYIGESKLVTNEVKRSLPGVSYMQNNRSLLGYKVWRLLPGQEIAEVAWTLLTPNIISETGFADADWINCPYGNYRWAIKAIYTNDVLSAPAFSNIISHISQIGTIAGLVRTAENEPIEGVNITAGEYSTSTNAMGAYILQVSAGYYTVTASKDGYVAYTQPNVGVVVGQTTTLHFTLQSVANEDNIHPVVATALNACSPNPFNRNTTIRYTVKSATPVTVEIYNLLGQKVRTLVNETKTQGEFTVLWDALDDNGAKVSTGVYFYKMKAGKYSATKKMILMK